MVLSFVVGVSLDTALADPWGSNHKMTRWSRATVPRAPRRWAGKAPRATHRPGFTDAPWDLRGRAWIPAAAPAAPRHRLHPRRPRGHAPLVPAHGARRRPRPQAPAVGRAASARSVGWGARGSGRPCSSWPGSPRVLSCC